MFGEKAQLAEGQAGRLVRMAEGQSITFKLTKRLADLRPIETLPDWIRAELGESGYPPLKPYGAAVLTRLGAGPEDAAFAVAADYLPAAHADPRVAADQV